MLRLQRLASGQLQNSSPCCASPELRSTHPGQGCSYDDRSPLTECEHAIVALHYCQGPAEGIDGRSRVSICTSVCQQLTAPHRWKANAGRQARFQQHAPGCASRPDCQEPRQLHRNVSAAPHLLREGGAGREVHVQQRARVAHQHGALGAVALAGHHANLHAEQGQGVSMTPDLVLVIQSFVNACVCLLLSVSSLAPCCAWQAMKLLECERSQQEASFTMATRESPHAEMANPP